MSYYLGNVEMSLMLTQSNLNLAELHTGALL